MIYFTCFVNALLTGICCEIKFCVAKKGHFRTPQSSAAGVALAGEQGVATAPGIRKVYPPVGK